MFRLTIRDVGLMAAASLATAIIMYSLWQADRAVLALRLSQVQVRAMKAEGHVEELRMQTRPIEKATNDPEMRRAN